MAFEFLNDIMEGIKGGGEGIADKLNLPDLEFDKTRAFLSDEKNVEALANANLEDLSNEVNQKTLHGFMEVVTQDYAEIGKRYEGGLDPVLAIVQKIKENRAAEEALKIEDHVNAAKAIQNADETIKALAEGGLQARGVMFLRTSKMAQQVVDAVLSWDKVRKFFGNENEPPGGLYKIALALKAIIQGTDPKEAFQAAAKGGTPEQPAPAAGEKPTEPATPKPEGEAPPETAEGQGNAALEEYKNKLTERLKTEGTKVTLYELLDLVMVGGGLLEPAEISAPVEKVIGLDKAPAEMQKVRQEVVHNYIKENPPEGMSILGVSGEKIEVKIDDATRSFEIEQKRGEGGRVVNTLREGDQWTENWDGNLSTLKAAADKLDEAKSSQ